MSEPEDFHIRERMRAIEATLKIKQNAYFEARGNNQPEVADKIEQEYRDLLTELRFINPGAELTSFEKTLEGEADLETQKHIWEKK